MLGTREYPFVNEPESKPASPKFSTNIMKKSGRGIIKGVPKRYEIKVASESLH
jgi:hypothetical protein